MGLARSAAAAPPRPPPVNARIDQLRRTLFHFLRRVWGMKSRHIFFLVSFKQTFSEGNSSPSSRVDAYDTYLHILILNASESFRLK